MKYKIIQALDADFLELQVNKLLDKGWKTIGGVAVAKEYAEALTFVQAMIRSEDEQRN